jgi:hypothetical protein
MLLPQSATWLHLTSTSPSTGSGFGASSSMAIFRGCTIWIALIGYLSVLIAKEANVLSQSLYLQGL